MISTPQLLDYVVAVLEATNRPLLAREICSALRLKGVYLEKTDLNRVLWKQNDRPGLVVDQETFKWRYVPDVARAAEDAKKRQAEIKSELSKNAELLEFWKDLGFEFVGVMRDRTERPFFFLGKEGGVYTLVGPAGNVLREKSLLCSQPETMSPSEFTLDQIKAAAEEILKDRHRQAIEKAHRTITFLRETELLREEVYLGPVAVQVEDAIPVSEVIFVGNVSPLEPCHLTFGWGTVLAPVYLVVNTLGIGVRSDTRYGVFKLCVYELIKRNWAIEREGELILTLTLDNGRAYIGSKDNHRLSL